MQPVTYMKPKTKRGKENFRSLKYGDGNVWLLVDRIQIYTSYSSRTVWDSVM